jgi:hypothetical protein
MKFSEYLVENPAVFDLDELKNQKYFDDAINKARTNSKIEETKEIQGYTLEFYVNRTVIMKKDDKDLVVLKYFNKKTGIGNGIKVSFVQRNKDAKSEDVYKLYELLVDIKGMVYSDTTQSKGGQKLWKALFYKYAGKFDLGFREVNDDGDEKVVKYDGRDIDKWWRRYYEEMYEDDNSYNSSLYMKKK